MKAILLLILLALGLLVFSGADNPAGASSAFPSLAGEPGGQGIRALKRSSGAEVDTTAGARDPFALPGLAPSSAGQEPVPVVALPVNPAPAQPALKVLGKQEDDEGWAVFISTSDKPGEVWVVREGETFNERFRISRLAPPTLVVKNLRSQQSQTFNIGKDEE